MNITTLLNYTALAYAFALPLSRAAISLFSVLLIVLWILEGNFKVKYQLLSTNKIVLSLLAFLLFNGISLLWSEHLVEALDYIKKYWYFLPLFAIFTSLKKEYVTKLMTAFILGMFISEMIAYGVFFELWTFKHASVQNPSPFMHHIEYSVFLAFTALILLNRIFNAGDAKHKLFYAFFFITVSGNLFLTAGRTGQLAFVVGLLVLAIVSFKSKVKALLVTLILSIAILGIAFTVSKTFHHRIITGKNNIVNIIKNKNYCTSWGSRVGAWILAGDIIENAPILGVGNADNMHQFHTLIDTKYPTIKCMHKSFMHMHNQYLQIWTGLGVVGLILFLLIFYYLYRLKIQNRTFSNIRYIYIAILLFAFIPEVLLHRQFSMALFTLVVGLLLAQHRIENEV
jgi:O-antigen ligase